VFMGMLPLAFKVQPVVADGTVDWWSMFHHDLNHSGYSTSRAPNTNNTIWNYTTGGSVWSSPAVVDGKVYVGSNDNNVHCLNASTGAHIWNYTTVSAWRSSPAVAYGKVYIGSWDHNFYCLNASTGAQIWNYTTGGVVDSSPAVVDGKVYVGSLDDNVYCLYASNGTLIWNYTTGANLYSSPAVVDGKVYIGSSDGKVYCLDALTGAHIWNYTTASNSSPAVAYGKVYVGSSDGKVYCLDALTGAQVWNYKTGAGVFSSPAVAEKKEAISAMHALYSIGGELGYVPQKEYGKSGVRIDCVWFDREGKIQVASEVETTATWKKDLISTWEVEPKLAIIVGFPKTDKVAQNLMQAIQL